MLKNTKTLLTLVTFLLVSFVLVGYVQAKTSEEVEAYKEQLRNEKQNTIDQYKMEAKETRQGLTEEKKQMVEEKRESVEEERMARQCENMNNRIDNRITNYQNNKQVHLDRYNNLLERLEEIALNLQGKGLDVSDLQARTAELKSMVDEYVSLYDTFIASLEAAKDYPCGGSDNAFKNAMQEALSALKAVRDQRRAIVEFYSTEIRQAIAALRLQARTMTQEGTSNE